MSTKYNNTKQNKQNKQKEQDKEDHKVLDECIKNNNLLLTQNKLTELEESEVEEYYNQINDELQRKHWVYMRINHDDETNDEESFTEEQQIELFARNINFWNTEYQNLDTSLDIKSLTRNLMVSHSREVSHALIKAKFTENMQKKIWVKVISLYQEEQLVKI